MNIPNPVELAFDPKESGEGIKTIFEDNIARTLWLSWRTGHIVSQYFLFDCWNSACRIKECAPPIMEADLIRCISGADFGFEDVKRWAPKAVKFFNEVKLRYVVKVVAPPSDKASATRETNRRDLVEHLTKVIALYTLWMDRGCTVGETKKEIELFEEHSRCRYFQDAEFAAKVKRCVCMLMDSDLLRGPCPEPAKEGDK